MASFEQRVGEPKLSKCGTYTSRTVKVGNRVLGHIEAPKLKPGERPEATYWACEQVVRLHNRGAVLRVTRAYLANLRTFGVKKLGARMPDGSTYVIGMDEVAKVVPEPGVPHLDIDKSLWEVTLPPEDERVAMTLSRMRVAGRGRKSSMTV